MKKIVLLYFCCMLIFACDNDNDLGLKVQNKTEYNQNDNFKVEKKDIYKILSSVKNIPITNAYGDNPNIESVSYQNDTVMYIINYSNGWAILSADKRVPSILAYSQNGNLNLNKITQNANLFSWFEMNEELIHTIKEKGTINIDSPYFSEWKFIDPQSYNKTMKLYTNENDDDYWYYIDSEFISNETIYTPHLTQTKWDQGAYDNNGNRLNYWNEYVPYTDMTYSKKAPSGCVAVGVSQMLYFLHNKIGVPNNMFSSGSCVGYIDNYSSSFNNLSASIWGEMTKNSYEDINSQKKTGILIGYIGTALNTNYGIEGSGANFKDVANVFNNWGINCTLEDYNGPKVISSLRAGMPVLVSAFHTNNLFSNHGHTWIIDGYRTDVNNYYEIYAQGINDSIYRITHEIPAGTPIKRIKRSTSSVNYVQMNWGWGQFYSDTDAYYYLWGDWETTVNSDVYKYKYKRKMYCGFTKK